MFFGSLEVNKVLRKIFLRFGRIPLMPKGLTTVFGQIRCDEKVGERIATIKWPKWWGREIEGCIDGIYVNEVGVSRESYGWWWISEEKSPEYQKAQKLKGEESLLGSMSSTMSCNNVRFQCTKCVVIDFRLSEELGGSETACSEVFLHNCCLICYISREWMRLIAVPFAQRNNSVPGSVLWFARSWKLRVCSEVAFSLAEWNYPTWGNYWLFNCLDRVS